ncbi:MAG: glycosyl transferase [Verrucomicrobia bacterium]|nr:glycosyl transferase [Verrucomicrobiota bacterium]
MALTPGRILYLVWHRPLSALKRSWLEGGPLQQARDARGRRQMRQRAACLPAPRTDTGAAAVELSLLTGRNYWDQAAFCLWSFATAAATPVRAVVYDDGTLDEVGVEALRRVTVDLRVVQREETLAKLEACLPRERYPVLRSRWDVYPHIRKLTDPHVGSTGWKLVLDSDLLFFRRPQFLLDWLRAPDRPLHAVDCEESYGYPRARLEALCGAQLPALCNVGLTGWQSEAFDWDEIERWCAALTERGRSSYYLEQGIVAMLAARASCAVAPAADYITLPVPPEDGECAAVMHHYVAGSKRAYFRRNWRTVLRRAGVPETLA